MANIFFRTKPIGDGNFEYIAPGRTSTGRIVARGDGIFSGSDTMGAAELNNAILDEAETILISMGGRASKTFREADNCWWRSTFAATCQLSYRP